jgi:hypothetical protein
MDRVLSSERVVPDRKLRTRSFFSFFLRKCPLFSTHFVKPSHALGLSQIQNDELNHSLRSCGAKFWPWWLCKPLPRVQETWCCQRQTIKIIFAINFAWTHHHYHHICRTDIHFAHKARIFHLLISERFLCFILFFEGNLRNFFLYTKFSPNY